MQSSLKQNSRPNNQPTNQLTQPTNANNDTGDIRSREEGHVFFVLKVCKHLCVRISHIFTTRSVDMLANNESLSIITRSSIDSLCPGSIPNGFVM